MTILAGMSDENLLTQIKALDQMVFARERSLVETHQRLLDARKEARDRRIKLPKHSFGMLDAAYSLCNRFWINDNWCLPLKPGQSVLVQLAQRLKSLGANVVDEKSL